VTTLLDGLFDFNSKPRKPEISAKQPRYLNPATPASPMIMLEPVGLLEEVAVMVEEVAFALEVAVFVPEVIAFVLEAAFVLEEATFMLVDVVVAWLVDVAVASLVVVLE
jgi:hypothetical protein